MLDAGFARTAEDITLVLGVRAEERNPWVGQRLARVAEHYSPLPSVVVVDSSALGTNGQRGIADTCARHGWLYVRDDAVGSYCPARAKNLGALAARSRLLFFSDVDCFGEADLFDRLLRTASALEMSEVLDTVLFLPVYHLTDAATERVERASGSLAIEPVLARAAFSPRDGDVAFVAPYSNCFLIRRDFYLMSGGQNVNFEGHGGEDFEYMLRVALVSAHLPLPKRPTANLFGPSQTGYFDAPPYVGFRRLFELAAQPAELAGLRLVHFAHPRPKPGDGWHREHLAKRARFEKHVGFYLERSDALALVDFVPRPHTARLLADPRLMGELALVARACGYRVVDDAYTGVADVVIGGPEQAPHRAHTLATIAEQPDGRLRVEHDAGTELPDLSGFLSFREVASPQGARRMLFQAELKSLQVSVRRAAADWRFGNDSYAVARLGLGSAFTAGGKPTSKMLRKVRKFLRSPARLVLDSALGQRLPFKRTSSD